MSLSEMAGAFPVVTPERELACLGVEEAVESPALVLELAIREGGEVISSVQQVVPLAALGTDVGALKRRVGARLDDPRFFYAGPLALVAREFELVALSRAATAFEIGSALAKQAHDAGYDARFDRIHGWPVPARTIYFAMDVLGRIEGNGLGWFLLQAELEDAIGVRDALEQLECPRLLERLRQGITLAVAQGGELASQVDEAWVAAEGLPVPARGPGDPWSAIDGHDEGQTYWLVRHEVRPRLAVWLEAHRDELVGG